MTCTGGGQSGSSSATVLVTPAPGTISLTALAPEQRVGSAISYNLLWTGGGGCDISYISNSGSSQAIVLIGVGSSGAVSDTENASGLVTYTLRCYSSTTTATATINWVTNPTLSILSTSSSTWVANEPYSLTWNSTSEPCVASGGAQGDGWTGSKALSGTQSIAESQQGTYVFTLVCGTTTSQVAVVVPTPFIQIYTGGGGTLDSQYLQGPLQWQSTVGPCTFVDGSAPSNGGVSVPPSGSATPASTAAGVYLFSLTCGSGASTLYAAAFAEVVHLVPTTLSASVATIALNGPVTLSWDSNGTYPCYASGGTGQAPWVGTLNARGSLIVTSTSAGTVTYGISCGNQPVTTTVTYVAVPATSANVQTPTVSLSTASAAPTEGQSISLVWNSANADSCTASGGAAGDGWSGTLATSGSKSVTETDAGTVTYSITCTGAPPAASATTTVVIKSTNTSTDSGGSTSSHGGGGAMDLLFMLGLTLTLCVRVKASDSGET